MLDETPADVLTLLTVEEAVALRTHLAHDYISYEPPYVPLRALLQRVMHLLDLRGL